MTFWFYKRIIRTKFTRNRQILPLLTQIEIFCYNIKWIVCYKHSIYHFSLITIFAKDEGIAKTMRCLCLFYYIRKSVFAPDFTIL